MLSGLEEYDLLKPFLVELSIIIWNWNNAYNITITNKNIIRRILYTKSLSKFLFSMFE